MSYAILGAAFLLVIFSLVRTIRSRTISGMKRRGDVEGLIGALRDPRRARAAAIALGELRASEAVPALIEAIRDPSNPVLFEALEAISRIGDPSAVEPLCATLSDPSFLRGKPGLPPDPLRWYVRRVAEIAEELDRRGHGLLVREALDGAYGDEVKGIIREMLEEEGLEGEGFDEALERRGFVKVAEIDYGPPAKLYWHPEHRFELMVVDAGDRFLVKGQKKYYVKAVSELGLETWDRSLGELMDRLRVSFPEFHLYCGGFMRLSEPFLRDLMGEMARRRSELEGLRRRLEEGQIREAALEEEYIRQRRELARLRGAVRGGMLALRSGEGSAEDVREGLMEEEKAEAEAEIAKFLASKERERLRELERLIERAEEELELLERTFDELLERGAAVCHVIGCSTAVRECGIGELGAVLDKTIEEVVTADRFGGFRRGVESGLRVYLEEVGHPWAMHAAEYVGLVDPGQVRWGDFSDLVEAAVGHSIVTHTRDVKVGERVVAKGKKTPARAVAAFLSRARRVAGLRAEGLPRRGGWMGNVMLGDVMTDIPLLLPLDRLWHGYISGTTGAGKSYLARVLVENAILEGVNVVVLDPTRQWSGIVSPASGPVLRRFDRFGIPRELARGFPARVILPGDEGRIELPEDLGELFRGCAVISMRGVGDAERCRVASEVLRYAYETHDKESDKLRTLLVLEEAHSFLPENVSPEAREEAVRVRNWIDRIAREMRKYGLNLLLITQSLSDFRREARMVRETTNTKFFMRSRDRAELQYISDYVSPETADMVRGLGPGEAVVVSPFMDPVRFAVRPPLSRVGELSDEEAEALQEAMRGREEFLRRLELISSREEVEERVLWLAREYERAGRQLIVKDLEEELGMSRRRVLEILKRMEERGLIRTRKLKKRGRPRAIIPVD